MDPRFTLILKRISPMLRRITYRLNVRCPYCSTDDLFQEALMYLWKAFRAGGLSDKTDSYILQGCYFHLKNYLRLLKDRNRCVSLECIRGEEAESPAEVLAAAGAPSHFEYLHHKLLIETILNNGLTSREKDMLRLSLGGLTTREIGKRLGVSHVRVVKLMESVRRKCAQYKE